MSRSMVTQTDVRIPTRDNHQVQIPGKTRLAGFRRIPGVFQPDSDGRPGNFSDPIADSFRLAILLQICAVQPHTVVAAHVSINRE